MPSEVLGPTIQNLTLTNANTEYTVALSPGCKYFSIKARGAHALRFAFVTGKVAASTAPFMTLEAGLIYSSPEKLAARDVDIFFASPDAGTVVEILEWSNEN